MANQPGLSDKLTSHLQAGRGIDVPDVTCVINWQMASTIEKYVHRIGRTGRAGKQGIAITFLGNEDEETMYDLKQGRLRRNVIIQSYTDIDGMAGRSEISKSPISQMNPELAHHQAAKQRITREMKVSFIRHRLDLNIFTDNLRAEQRKRDEDE